MFIPSLAALGVVNLIFIATLARRSKSLCGYFSWLFLGFFSLSKLIELLPYNFLQEKFPTTFNYILVITLGFLGLY